MRSLWRLSAETSQGRRENIGFNTKLQTMIPMFMEAFLKLDCYMEALSPAKACDSRAVYGARSFSEKEGPNTNITKNAFHFAYKYTWSTLKAVWDFFNI